jgi:deferrochelatase/peroxidase EfeB
MDTEPAAEVSVIAGFGASLFDERFGLADRKPAELEPMPFPAGDGDLDLDPTRTHGDLSLTVSAGATDVALLALRRLLQATDGSLALRWMVDGHNRPIPDAVEGGAPYRNLLGFRDGTSNLDVDDPATMDRYVWVYPGGDEPAWAGGGTYQAVRIIRMFVERWDRIELAEQELVIGRRRGSGASLGNERETDPIDYLSDPNGAVVPLDAHVRLANPHTPQTADNLILRRGFSYTRGADSTGQVDQGLLFSSFQALLSKGFLAVQERLDGEPLEAFTAVVGGGFFFVPPGVESPDGYLGEGLFA